MRPLTPLAPLALVLAAAALAGCNGFSLMSTSGRVTAGAPAPDVEGRDADGQAFRLSDYRGKVVLLAFWHNT